MDKITEHKPLLTKADYESMQASVSTLADVNWSFGVKMCMDFYEAKIASGELRVVETTVPYEEGIGWSCQCGYFWGGSAPSAGMFCPGCGAKVIKG